MPQTNGDRTFSNPTDAVKRRDPKDYRELLYKLIDANESNRHDQIGTWETDAAWKELKKIGSKLTDSA